MFDALTIAEPWDVSDVQKVLAGLETAGFSLFQGELMASAGTAEAKGAGPLANLTGLSAPCLKRQGARCVCCTG